MLAFLAAHSIAASAASDGTAIGDLAESMQPGTWAELTTINAHAAFSASNSIFEFADQMVWDSVGKKAYFLGSSDPIASAGDSKFIEYSAATNTWSILPAPAFIASQLVHSYHHHAIDPASRRLWYQRAFTKQFWEYNLDTGVWTRKTDVSVGFLEDGVGVSFFPERL